MEHKIRKASKHHILDILLLSKSIKGNYLYLIHFNMVEKAKVEKATEEVKNTEPVEKTMADEMLEEVLKRKERESQQ